jgi:hypothetical protein
MPATYVTEAELRSALGIQSLYTSAVVEEVCQAAENIVKGKLWFNTQSVYAIEATGTTGRIYIYENADQFVVGDTINVENVRQHFNGSSVITKKNGGWLEFVDNQITTLEYHTIAPWGRVYGTQSIDYATLPEVNQATLMIAVDIWQARQASNAGGISPDFQPSPYRMGNTLMARVRGLLADHLAPGGQVG